MRLELIMNPKSTITPAMMLKNHSLTISHARQLSAQRERINAQIGVLNENWTLRLSVTLPTDVVESKFARVSLRQLLLTRWCLFSYRGRGGYYPRQYNGPRQNYRGNQNYRPMRNHRNQNNVEGRNPADKPQGNVQQSQSQPAPVVAN
jgi:hypothetical protein